MRLIDADALIECLQTWKTVAVSEGLPINERFAMAMIAQVNLMPTIEPERKKGKWIPLQLSMANPPYQCSCCFRNAPMVETGCLVNRHLEAFLTDFCPNCGADMRKPEDIPMEYYESGGR